MMTQRQWQDVEAIVRKEQERALQHMNTHRYNELADILDHLYDPAHCDDLACTEFLGDHDV